MKTHRPILVATVWSILCSLFCCRTVAAQDAAFLLRFDSLIAIESEAPTVTAHVTASYIVREDETEAGKFRGMGRLRYVDLTGIDAIPTDGVMTVFEMQVSSDNGTVVLDWTPGGPPPSEWVLPPPEAPPGIPATQFFQWLAAFSSLHENEFDLGTGFYTIDDWTYPSLEIYASKEYDRSKNVSGVTFVEQTTVELIAITPPRIDKINIESKGSSIDDPETGEQVELTADLFVPVPFDVERCTWTGNNFTGKGNGDPEDMCRWSYEPRKGEGPKRETYGDKDLRLTVTYSFGPDSTALDQARSEDYKVFFPKREDDDSDKQPNWFDYWGDDGAVPGLDDSDVDYDPSPGSIAYANSGTVFMGPAAAETDGPISVPQNDICVGGEFPGGDGIDLAALTLAHERKHIEVDNLVGDDTDGDDVPDIAEAGTSPDDPDSCNLAAVIDPEYATYGDNEFLARQAELGVVGVATNDWALPGRQTKQSSANAGAALPAASGFSPKPRNAGIGTTHPEGIARSAGGQTVSGIIDSETIDTDGDGLFDLLHVNVEIVADENREYAVLAWVADDEGAEVLWSRSILQLPIGSHTVELDFSGPDLYRLGASNPIQVARIELLALIGKHSVLRDTLNTAHGTGAISADFDPPAALLGGVLSEMPIDQDADGLYDSLDFTVELEVFDPGTYEVSAVLAGQSLSVLASESVTIGAATPSSYSNIQGTTSTEQVVLSLDGASVFYYREDGPYELIELRVRDASDGSELDFRANAWTSSTYTHAEFQQTSVIIDDTSYADMGGNVDEDGKFMTLEVTFAIGSGAPGPYSVSGRLEDATGRTIARAAQAIGLAGVEGYPETTSAQLSFDGADIAASNADGPYQLADVTVISDAGELMDQNPVPYVTGAYSANDFSSSEPPPPEEVIHRDGFE